MYVDYKKIGIRIAQRRKKIKMKQNVLAKKTNLSNNHISNIENGYSVPSIETFAKICNALNISPDYLLLGTLKINNIPQNIVDKLNLCNDKSLSLISKIIDIVLSEQE
jgi:transcriptional regulator with XRE-family HTH domain